MSITRKDSVQMSSPVTSRGKVYGGEFSKVGSFPRVETFREEFSKLKISEGNFLRGIFLELAEIFSFIELRMLTFLGSGASINLAFHVFLSIQKRKESHTPPFSSITFDQNSHSHFTCSNQIS